MNLKRISYRYTNNAKQVAILAVMLYYLLQFVIMMQIIIFKLEGFYEYTNIPGTILSYALIFFLLIVLFRGHTFCYSTYDENSITYYNKLLRKSKSFNFSDAKMVVFDTFGVKFYADTQVDYKHEKPIFFIPFFRDGVVKAIEINNFYKMMSQREDIKVIKTFTVLPGYTNKWKFVTVAYGFLAAAIILQMATPITVIIVVAQAVM